MFASEKTRRERNKKSESVTIYWWIG